MKKITVYRIILVILVITALVLVVFVIKKNVESNKIENNTQSVLQEIKKEKKSNPNDIDVIQEIDQEIEGYKVVGIINIPKINIEYPKLEIIYNKILWRKNQSNWKCSASRAQQFEQ